MLITSLSNKKIKNLVTLLQKPKLRKEQDIFLVEGSKMFLEAKEEYLREIYVRQDFLEKEGSSGKIRERLERCGYEIVAEEVFKKISSTVSPQGIVAVVKQYHYRLEQLLERKNPLLLLLEDIQDPGNLGTMIRTAEGAGVHGVIMNRNTVDIYNPKTIRSTMGSIYRVPFYYTDDLKDTMNLLKKQGVRIYAAHLKGERLYHKTDYTSGTAFLIGNEGNGLKKETADLADYYLKIPMQGQVESLNAAVASVILMYEAARQRME